MTTFGDRLYQLGGTPVGGSGGFQGWWKDDTYFVDYDNGSKNNGGKKPDDACKYLQDAIDLSGEFDTVYIRPRDPDITGGDSNYHLPESTTNYSISSAKEGMSLIGTGLGVDGHGMAYQTYIRGQATSPTTGNVLTIGAPFCSIENLAFHRGSVTGGNQVNFTPGISAFAGSVNNCLFRFNDGADAESGALNVHDAWYTMIYNNVFYRNAMGITLEADTSSVRCVTIKGNIFQGAAGDVYNHVASSGNVQYVTIVDNYFIESLPTKGTRDYYIDMGVSTACTGIIANNVFGTTETVGATLCHLNGLTFAKNFVSSTNAITA